MKFAWGTTLLLLSTSAWSLAIPGSEVSDPTDGDSSTELSHFVSLEKRRGGGGGGRGGSSGSSSGSSGGSSGGRSGSSSGSSGSSGSSSSGGRTGSSGSGSSGSSGSSNSRSGSSNVGGTTSSGSGTRASYGKGSYYAGGATTPYRSGSRSKGSNIAPYVLGGAALGFFPGIWLYSAYAYPYSHNYHYYNQDEHKNETYPVICVCQEYSECGCDDNTNRTYYESLFNGTEPKNSSVVRVVKEANGTETIYINGTLPNGTTAASGDSSSGGSPLATALEASGFWVTVATVVGMVYF
ncbi:unnamed protein product [Penicillium olsonii]|uniref:DUF7732 domain-containing protein n=1 Tax=Penicillium olsonii TaxID=99116 RepID=A0A9W4I4Q7_PENOL|nr:unnamed protein product [Penicillium olsonii]CAG8006235.1 unnamed protein product [Penicillium olsonii]CAG8221608.1 unnamed protein product [Penicillium olsonii]